MLVSTRPLPRIRVMEVPLVHTLIQPGVVYVCESGYVISVTQVGEIKLVTDPAGEDAEDKGKLFSIHLNDRDYLLKAVDAAAAARWVEVLNQLKNNANTNVAEPKDAEGADKAGAEFNKSSRGLRACLPCCFN